MIGATNMGIFWRSKKDAAREAAVEAEKSEIRTISENVVQKQRELNTLLRERRNDSTLNIFFSTGGEKRIK